MSRSLDAASFFYRGFDSIVIQEDLVCQDETRQVPALMQVIALMTMGKDMSPLFTEISSLASSANTTLKRLAFLYLQQYSKVQPEKAVLQAGTFVKDTLNESPLIRGAGIRTMTSLQVAVVTDFVKAPLRRLLEDPDPYVRRNAVLAVLKSLCVSHVLLSSGLLEKVIEMLYDDSPVVVAACIVTLQELNQRGMVSGVERHFEKVKAHLVQLLDKATEWPAFYILEGLAESYEVNTKENSEVFLKNNEDAIMRILPFTCFTNSALVLAASKAICQFMLCCERCLPQRERWEIEERFGPCLARALVSQLAAPRYEMRYVTLRNIQMVLCTSFMRFFHPSLSSFRLLFIDPLYVKQEKIKCLVALANEQCGKAVVEELFTHATSSSGSLACESIRAIGAVASSIENLAGPTVLLLESLIESKIPRVVEEAVMVLHNLLRSYPDRFSAAAQSLCDSLAVVKNHEAMAAVVWAVGEQADQLRNPMQYLTQFVEEFSIQPQMLQIAVLTTVAQLFVRSDEGGEKQVTTQAIEQVLNHAVHASDPMLRDRALFYLRLLTTDPLTAKRVLSIKTIVPGVKNNSAEKQSMVRQLSMMGTLVSVKHKPISLLLNDEMAGALESGSDEEEEVIDEDEEPVAQSSSPTEELGRDPVLQENPVSFSTVLFPEESNGLKVEMMWDQLAAKLVLAVRFTLTQGEDCVTQAVVEDLQVNRNAFGIGVAQVFPVTKIRTESDEEVNIVVSSNNQCRSTAGIEIALNVQPIGIRYFLAPPVPPLYLLLPPVQMDKSTYAQLRAKHLVPSWNYSLTSTPLRCSAARLSVNTFRMFSLTLIHRSVTDRCVGFYLYGETTSHEQILYELTISNDTVECLSVFTQQASIAFFFGEYLAQLLRRVAP